LFSDVFVSFSSPVIAEMLQLLSLLIVTVTLLCDGAQGQTWLQRYADIDGEAVGDGSGYAVALSGDGARLAIGAPLNAGDSGSQSGHVRVYRDNGVAWIQLGDDIDGEAQGDNSVLLSSIRCFFACSYHNTPGQFVGDVG
jgi:hypothetical protein